MNVASYLMTSHSDIQAKIHAGLDTILSGKYHLIDAKNRRSSTEFDLDDKPRPCSLEDVQEMTYLDLIAKRMRVICPAQVQLMIMNESRLNIEKAQVATLK